MRTSAALLMLVFAAALAMTSFAEDPPSASSPVVLELFTSQGCSSCPPADRLLTELAAADPSGAEVVALSFHVDYWNYIGWTDPFSSEEWSNRQREYGRAFREERIYTPQLVIDGRVHCVGSQRECVRREIEAARARPRRARVDLSVREGKAGELVATVDANWLGKAGGSPLAVMVALYETGLATPVKRGENARRELHNDFVVRRLERAGTLPTSAAQRQSHAVTLPLDPAWHSDHLGIAAFLQDPNSREIFAAARWSP